MSEEKYVSGEAHRTMDKTSRDNRKVTVPVRTVGAAAVVIVFCIASFAGGINYQKHHGGSSSTTSAGRTSQFGTGGFQGRRGGGEIGQVTAVSDTSITVQNQRTSASATYAITSDTTISDDSQTVAASDIKSGDSVLITTSTTDTKTATRILVNPSFGGAAGGPGGDVSGTDSQSDTTTDNSQTN